MWEECFQFDSTKHRGQYMCLSSLWLRSDSSNMQLSDYNFTSITCEKSASSLTLLNTMVISTRVFYRCMWLRCSCLIIISPKSHERRVLPVWLYQRQWLLAHKCLSSVHVTEMQQFDYNFTTREKSVSRFRFRLVTPNQKEIILKLAWTYQWCFLFVTENFIEHSWQKLPSDHGGSEFNKSKNKETLKHLSITYDRNYRAIKFLFCNNRGSCRYKSR